MNINKDSNTTDVGYELAISVMKFLRDEDRDVPTSEIVSKIEEDLKKISNPPTWLYELEDSNQSPKWLTCMRFTTSRLVKAKYLNKENRIWSLLGVEGQTGHISDEEIKKRLDHSMEIYRANLKKKREKQKNKIIETDAPTENGISSDAIEEMEKADENLSIEKIRKQGNDSVQTFIDNMDPYEYQELAAALLRGMGYYIANVAAKGKDGGVDIVAYCDPLGASQPRLKVQIKHYQSTIAAKDIRELHGLLTDGEIGIFICNSKFSLDAKKEARSAHKHLRLIDGKEFIKLWHEYYEKMEENDKARMPLTTVTFLDEKRIIEE